MIKKLNEYGVSFGSRRWGGWVEDSDYDRIISMPEYQDMIAYRDVRPKRDHQYDSNGVLGNSFHIYIGEDGKTYNFLVYTNKVRYEIALKCTNDLDAVMLTPIGAIVNTSKSFRYKIVEGIFKGAHKLYFGRTSTPLSDLYEEVTMDTILTSTPAKDKRAQASYTRDSRRNPFTVRGTAMSQDEIQPVYAQAVEDRNERVPTATWQQLDGTAVSRADTIQPQEFLRADTTDQSVSW